MPNPPHGHKFVTHIAPRLTESFERDRKIEAAKYFAQIATDLADDARDDRRAGLAQVWNDWSDQVVRPLTPHLESAIVESPTGSRGLNRDRKYAWICFNTPVANRGITSTLVTTLGLRPGPHSDQAWDDAIDEWSIVDGTDLQRLGIKLVQGDENLPKPGQLELMTRHRLSPRLIGTTKKRFYSKSVSIYQVNHGALYSSLARQAMHLAHSSRYDSVNFRLASKAVDPFGAGSHISAGGTVSKPALSRQIATPFDVLAGSSYVDEKSDNGDERAALSAIIDELGPMQLNAAAKGTLKRNVAESKLIEAAEPRAEDIKQNDLTAVRILELVTKSKAFKDLIV